MRFGARATVLAAGVAALALAAGSAKGELIVNGGFETGDFTGWSYVGDNTYVGADSNSAYSGTYGAYFGPVTNPGFISQVIPTVTGQSYMLSFDLMNDDYAPNMFTVAIDGNQQTSIVDSDPFGWTPFDVNFTAASDLTEIEFGFRNDPGWWHLDNVSVSEVPEPTSLALLGVTVGLLTARRRSM